MTDEQKRAILHAISQAKTTSHACDAVNELFSAGIADTPRYNEWRYLRAHGQWSGGIPEWARDSRGKMNDMAAAVAVIEELAAAVSTSASIADTAGAKPDRWADKTIACHECRLTYGESHMLSDIASGRVAVAAPPAPSVADAAGAPPPGDTVYQAPYAGHAFRYHSDDQIVEYANTRVAELHERIAELERDIELSQKLR